MLFSVHADVALVDFHFHADYELKVIIPSMVFHSQCVHCVQSSIIKLFLYLIILFLAT